MWCFVVRGSCTFVTRHATVSVAPDSISLVFYRGRGNCMSTTRDATTSVVLHHLMQLHVLQCDCNFNCLLIFFSYFYFCVWFFLSFFPTQGVFFYYKSRNLVTCPPQRAIACAAPRMQLHKHQLNGAKKIRSVWCSHMCVFY